MNPCAFSLVRILGCSLAVALFGISSRCTAANLLVAITAADSVAADSAYPGSGSTISTRTDNQTGITVAVAGRNYGVDPAANAARWGVRAGALPWRENQRGIVVTNGLTPTAAGSKVTEGGAAASYISIGLSNVPANTLFQNLTVEFDGMAFIGAANAWAASSVGGFNNWSVASLQSNGRKLVASIPEFTWPGMGADPLELRIYGVTGVDEGALTTVRVSASVTSAPQVPEPAAPLLAGLTLAVWAGRRRRQR